MSMWKAAHLLSTTFVNVSPPSTSGDPLRSNDMTSTKHLGKNKCFVAPPPLEFHIANGF